MKIESKTYRIKPLVWKKEGTTMYGRGMPLSNYRIEHLDEHKKRIEETTKNYSVLVGEFNGLGKIDSYEDGQKIAEQHHIRDISKYLEEV